MKEYTIEDRISNEEIKQEFWQSTVKEQCINETGRNVWID
jgi:hypothetical protein